jgi:hypothetical protein
MSTTKSTLDFDEEAKKLWERLNLEGVERSRGQWNALDSLYRDPVTGGTLYVGNQTAAQSLSLLRSSGITHVVNCTHGSSKIPNYHPTVLSYYEFPISNWHNIISGHEPSAVFGKPLAHIMCMNATYFHRRAAFVDPLFAYVDSALKNGSSVLVSIYVPISTSFSCRLMRYSSDTLPCWRAQGGHHWLPLSHALCR